MQADNDQGRINETLRLWVADHEDRIQRLVAAVTGIANRVEQFGETGTERLRDESYLTLVSKGFRVWDRSDTEIKRQNVQRLLANTAGTSLTDDDVIRLFLDWIDRYHDSHLQIIRIVYASPGVTRLAMWRSMGRPGTLPREDSSDADLFRMLIHDLSTGRVIRQQRQKTHDGQFVKKAPVRRARGSATAVMKSSFDDTERYELSELGSEFVHYVLQDVVTRIDEHVDD